MDTCRYIYSLYFVSLTVYKGWKTNNQMWIHMAVEVMSLYIFIDKFIWIMFRLFTCVTERASLVCFIAFKSIYIKYVNSVPKLKATISHDLCYVLGFFFFLSYVATLHLLWRREGVGICLNHLQPVFPWLSGIKNGLE